MTAFNARKIASARLARRVPYAILIAKQRERLAKIDERLGRLMTQRVDEEEVLAEMIALAPKCVTP